MEGRCELGGDLAENVPDRFLAVARVVRPQGRRGEVLAEPLTDFPARFKELREVFLESPGTAPQPIKVENVWPHKGRVVIKFSGVDSIRERFSFEGPACADSGGRQNAASSESLLPLGTRRLPGGHGTQGRQVEVGTVTEIEPTGGVDVLHVATSRGEVLIPLAQAICTKIDTRSEDDLD